MTTVFEGYTKAGKPVTIVRTDGGNIRIIYKDTGAVRHFNSEWYSLEESQSSSFRIALMNAGFRTKK